MPYDITKPIEIAPHIYWVGYVIPDDPFQCHVYLIENGDESILIDPGSKITWPVTRQKILEILPLEKIEYFITHHQDPDITACLGDIFDEIGTEGRKVVTHWRTVNLLKHYDWGVEFYEIEKHGWKLQAGERTLEFIFTPYMHFPGAFCTRDTQSAILFSSDIFGAFTDKFQLFADNAAEYFERMKPFHTHYMPSKAIVEHGLNNILHHEISMICPQHGSIIPKEMIPSITSWLRDLDVGLFLEYDGDHEVRYLSRAEEIVQQLFIFAAYGTNGFDRIEKIFGLLRELFPIRRAMALATFDTENVLMDSDDPQPVMGRFSNGELQAMIDRWFNRADFHLEIRKDLFGTELGEELLIYCFPSRDESGSFIGITCLLFPREKHPFKSYELKVLQRLHLPFDLILNKTLQYIKSEEEKHRFFLSSITDSLTGLYNRHYLIETGNKAYVNAQRYGYPLSCAVIDLDRFKSINDRYGHAIGDRILKDFAHCMRQSTREGDFVYRYGGEEFVLLLPHTDGEEAKELLERLREMMIASGGAEVGEKKIPYTFSAGIQEIDAQGGSLSQALQQADRKLYMAKESGRDRIVL